MATTGAEHASSEQATNRIPWPETGPITVLVTVPLLEHLLGIAMPIMVRNFQPVFPDLVPTPFRTATTVLFWAAVGVTLTALVVRRAINYSEEYDSRDDLETNLEGELPSAYRYVGYLGAMLVGTAVAWWSYDSFVVAFEAFVDLFVVRVGAISYGASPVEVLYGVAFLAGVAAAAAAVDRAAIGLLRTAFLRVYSPKAGRTSAG